MRKVTAIVMLFLLTGTLFLVFTAGNTSAQSPEISNVRISNPISSSVTISWVASSSSAGRVDYGPTQAYGETAYDNEFRMNGVVTVTITGLVPETSYYYMITAVNNGGENTVTGTFRTAKEGFGQPYSVYGQILCMDGSPASSTMVYVTVEHQGVESQLLSDMTSPEGYWSVDLANLKDKNGAVYSWYNGDSIKTEAQGGTMGYGCKQGTIGLHSYYSQIFLRTLSLTLDTINIREVITFNTSHYNIKHYFDFGDGTNSSWRTEPVVAHVFLTSGTYNVSLKVRDNHSESNNVAYVIITVTTGQSSEPENFIPFLGIEIVILCIFGFAMLLKYKRKRR